MTAEDLQRGLKYAQCMREHGIDWPDPNPNQAGSQPQGRNDDDPLNKLRELPQFEETNLQCRMKSVE